VFNFTSRPPYPQFPSNRWLFGLPNRSGHCRRENHFPLTEIEPRFRGRPACRLATVPTELSRSAFVATTTPQAEQHCLYVATARSSDHIRGRFAVASHRILLHWRQIHLAGMALQRLSTIPTACRVRRTSTSYKDSHCFADVFLQFIYHWHGTINIWPHTCGVF
jgi:hypothetical protein